MVKGLSILYIGIKASGKILTAAFFAFALSGCTIAAELINMVSQKPKDIEVGTIPSVNQDNQNSVVVSGTCLPGVDSFIITSPPPEKTVVCENGEWSVELDLSQEPEGPITLVTNKPDPNTGELIEFEISKDTTPPALTSLVLENGDPITNKSLLSYQVLGEDIAQVYVTEDPACASGGQWQSALATVPVSDGDSSKTFYAKGRDSVGNATGCVLTTSITLDQTSPVITGLNDDLVIKASKSWTWSCTELHGPCVYSYSISQDSTTVPDGTFSAVTSASQLSGDGLFYLAVQARDRAGNVSEVRRVQVNLSSNLPSLLVQNGAAYHSSGNVQLQLSNFSYFDVVEISNTASCLSPSSLAAASTLPWTLTAGDGAKTIYYRFKNSTTSEITGCYDASIIVDSTAPIVTGLGNDAIPRTSKTWNWSCTDVTNCSFRYVIDQSATTLPSGTYGSVTSATQASGNGTYYIHVQARDELGNESAVVHVQVVLDNTAPTLLGLSDDLTPQKSKTWNWSCSDVHACQTRFVIDQAAATQPSGAYSAVTSASQNTGNGNYYLHIQLKDAAGNESATQHFRVILDNTAPVITGLANDAVVKKSKSFSWACTDTYGPCTFRHVIDSSPSTVPSTAYSSTTSVTHATGSGTFYLHVQARDVAGNESISHVSFVLDNSNPTVTLASSAPEPGNTSPIPVTVTFNESVTGFTASDVVVTNGTISGFTGSGTSYSFSVTPTAPGAVTVAIAAGVATDAAGNTNNAATTLSRTYDNGKPTITLSSTTSAITNVSPIPVTVTFNEAVTGFTASDVVVTNGTLSGFTGSGTSYSFSVTPTAQGAVTVAIAAGVATDAAGNTNTAATTLTRTYDSVKPNVTLASSAADPTNTSPIPVAVTFSESVTGFVASDVVVTNGTLSAFTGSGTSYSFSVTPTGQGAVTVAIAAGVAADTAGNTNNAATTLTRTYDSGKPTVTLASTAGASTNVSPIPITVTFNESVTGFIASDVVVTNGTLSGFTGSGASYSFSVTPTAQGAVTVAVAAGVAADSAGNTNTAATTLSRTYDTVKPNVTLASAAANPTNVTSIPVTVTFSEAVTGFIASDLTITNGTVSGFTGSGTSYSFSVTPTAQGTVTVALAAGMAADAAGNTNNAATSISRTFDSSKPTVTLASTAPASVNVSPIPVTVTFSENVTDFVSTDVTVTNGTISGFTGSGASYSFNVIPTAQGTITVAVAAGVAADSAGNTNTAATSLTRIYDSVKPNVTLSSTTSSPTKVSPIPVTAVFNESVTGFVAGDITVTNGTVSGFSGSGTTYTFNVTPSGQATVTIAVASGVAADAAGNTNTASTNLIRVFDNVAPASPTISINSAATYTTSNSVSLSLSASGSPTQMYITNTAGCTAGGSWATYATTSGWTLGQTNATATVYVKYRDEALNESSCVSDTIIHDNVAPTTVASLNDGTYITSLTSSPALSWPASSDAVSGLNNYEFALGTTSGGTNIVNWTNIGNVTSYTRTGLSLAHGTRYYPSIRVKDKAGNTSGVRTGDGWVPDNAGPAAPATVTLGATTVAVVTETPTLSFTAAVDGHSGTSYHQARLLRVSDSAVIRDWATHTSGNKVTGLSLAMNTSYRFEVRGIDAVGNIGAVRTSGNFSTPAQTLITWTITSATTGYIEGALHGYRDYYDSYEGLNGFGSVATKVISGYTLRSAYYDDYNTFAQPLPVVVINHSGSLAGKKVWFTNNAGTQVGGGPYTMTDKAIAVDSTNLGTGGSMLHGANPSGFKFSAGTTYKVVLCISGC